MKVIYVYHGKKSAIMNGCCDKHGQSLQFFAKNKNIVIGSSSPFRNPWYSLIGL